MQPKRYQVVPLELNQRRFERVRLNDAVELRSGDDPLGAVSCDISAGGLRFQSSKFFPVNSELNVVVRLDAHAHLAFKGQVKWVNRVAFAEDDQYQIGVAFDTDSVFEQNPEFQEFLNWKLNKL